MSKFCHFTVGLYQFFLFALLLCLLPQCARAQTEPVDHVSTLVGTMSSHHLSTGNTYPAVGMPWGMNTWTPMTGERGSGWTYTYTADTLTGLKLTHQPSPWINDYGQLILMPFAAQQRPKPGALEPSSHFSHKAETATPYYYSVYLADHDITAELAPTERAAALRFTSRAGMHLLIDALDGGQVTFAPDRRHATGYTTKNSGGVPSNFRLYFAIGFDREWTSADTLAHQGIASFGGTVNCRVAASFISAEQAWRNLRELGDGTLEQIAAQGRDKWNEALGRIRIEDDNTDRLRTFYSCLYRCLLFPRALYEHDADGRPVHYSPYNGQVLPGRIYTDTGFWDTFRALFPLLNLVYPDRAAEIQEGLANTYRESGFLPEWASPGHRGCMVGNNSASVVADAYLSGIHMDAELLWEAVTHGAHAVHPHVSSTGRLGWQGYDSLGYVPYGAGIDESVARTLEYAYDDWCIHRFGRALGKPDSVTAPYARRALNYRNVFDRASGLMRGRLADGTFQSPFNPFKWGDAFTEGNAWHYTWSVFHDPAGLAALMASAGHAASAMLDSVFTLPPVFDDSYYGFVIHEIREMQIMRMGQYAHGNQPIQHAIYLYDWLGQPWKAQQRVRQVMDRLYAPTPDGYCGDEDNGQTSAWYVFSALGFYPVCPASGQYAIGSPLFRKATINGRVTITTDADAPYISALFVDGRPHTRNYITLDLLRRGATLDFRMSRTPNPSRGTQPADAPYSFSK